MSKISIQGSPDFQRLFNEVANSSGDLIIIADPGRQIVYVNSSACEKTGYSKKELVGARISILYRKENQSKYTAKVFTDLRKKGRWYGEMEIRKKDGTTFWA